MSSTTETSVFKVITWAVSRKKGPWFFDARNGWCDTSGRPHTIYQDRHDAAFEEMRLQYDEAHKPTLADQIADELVAEMKDRSWDLKANRRHIVDAIERVLGKEGDSGPMELPCGRMRRLHGGAVFAYKTTHRAVPPNLGARITGENGYADTWFCTGCPDCRVPGDGS